MRRRGSLLYEGDAGTERAEIHDRMLMTCHFWARGRSLRIEYQDYCRETPGEQGELQTPFLSQLSEPIQRQIVRANESTATV